MKVLLVSESGQNYKIDSVKFLDPSWHVFHFEENTQVLHRVQEINPDVVLFRLESFHKCWNWIFQIRSSGLNSHLPIIIFGGNTTVKERVELLNAGADDYWIGGLTSDECQAKVRVLYRRVKLSQEMGHPKVISGNLIIDFGSYKVTVGEEPIPLTLTEFKILGELVKKNGQVLSRDLLRESALGHMNVTDRTIDVHVAALRKKLKLMGTSIETVRGVGYRFLQAEGVITN